VPRQATNCPPRLAFGSRKHGHSLLAFGSWLRHTNSKANIRRKQALPRSDHQNQTELPIKNLDFIRAILANRE
jgi:hypothetical protein